MSDDYTLPAAELDAAAAALTGRRIAHVAYHGLLQERLARTPWDFDTWHCPVMGVELTLDDGTPFSAVWDNTFGHFSMRLDASPMNEHEPTQEEDGASTRWTVQDHPRWAPLLSDPVVDSRLLWHPDLTDAGRTAPAALRLAFPRGTAWIIAAMQQRDDSWWLGADEVVVAFTEDMAARIGIAGSP